MDGKRVPPLRIAPLLLSFALTTIVVLAPVVLFATWTRTSVESDIAGRARDARASTAQLVAAMVRQRIEHDATDLATMAARPMIAEAIAAHDRARLESLFAPDLQRFAAIGIVDGTGTVVAHSAFHEIRMDPGLASDVAKLGRAPGSAGSSTYVLSGIDLPGPGTWSFIGNDGRPPMRWGSVGMFVVPFEADGQPFTIYGNLSVFDLRSVLDLVSLQTGRELVVFDEFGRVILAAGDGPEFAAPIGTNPDHWDDIPGDAATFAPYLVPAVAVPGLHESLARSIVSEDLTIDGHRFLASAEPALPGHWAVYVLDRPVTIADTLTQAVTLASVGALVAALVLAVLLAVLIERLRRQRTQLARLAVSEERLRFARDLHDLLGRSLSLIALKSELANRLVAVDTTRARHEIAEVERVSRDALRDVRQAVVGYRAPTLAAEIEAARDALKAAGIQCRVERSADGLPEAVDALFAWTVREGVTNVVRHSGAGQCDIRVRRGEREIEIEVVDDGVGGASAEGNGLRGLRERASARGGIAHAAPLSGGGYRLRVTVPTASA